METILEEIIYIDKMNNNAESIEGFVGKVVHEVLEWIYLKKLDYYIWDHIERKYLEIWNDRWHNKIYLAEIKKKYSKDYFKRLGLECTRNYYKNNGGPKIKHDNIIGTEVPIEITISKYKFKGIIDRIDKDEEYISIHDYKTGKPKNKKEMLYDLQLIIYLLAIRKRFKKKNNIILNWHFLKEQSLIKQHIKIKHTDKNVEKLKDNIIKGAKSIELAIKKNDFPPNPNFLCHWCYYWENCKEKKIYNEKNPAINIE